MARAFDESEKRIVEKNLLEAGCALFGRSGFSRTGIDDIVAMAGVAKGTFYRFWDSKEAFFFACMEDTEMRFRQEMIAPLLVSENHPAEILEQLIRLTMKGSEDFPMIRIAMDPSLLNRLARKLPPETLLNHQEKDRSEFADITAAWDPEVFDPGIAPEIFDGLFKGLLMISAHRDIIGEDILPDVIDTTAKVLSAGLKAISDERIGTRGTNGGRKGRK